MTFPHILFVNTMEENWGIKRSHPCFPGQQDYLNIGPLKIQSLINGKIILHSINNISSHILTA